MGKTHYNIVSVNKRKDRAMIIAKGRTYHCQWDTGRNGWRAVKQADKAYGKQTPLINSEWIFFH